MYVTVLYNVVAFPNVYPNMGTVYALFANHGDTWYVGKAQRLREKGKQLWPGITARFREYSINCIRKLADQSHRERYKKWYSASVSSLMVLPCIFDHDKNIECREKLCIDALQPPTQQSFMLVEKSRK